MNWVEHAIWWHVYPLGFVGAPIREPEQGIHHRLPRLTNWLDYAVELGTSGLLLNPIFASDSHGYDINNYFEIDPRLGDQTDLDAFLAECKSRGLRVLFDGVFSHASKHFDHPELFDLQPDGTPNVFEGHENLLRLNHNNPATVDFVVNVMTHWLSRGIDGWRLDAAYSIATDFWAQVIPRVKEQYPDAWIMGEVIHGDYNEFVEQSKVDSITEYELWKSIWSSISNKNFFELDWTLQRHNDFLHHFTPTTFIGNHDVTRIASYVGTDGAALTLAILMTVGGIPTIYYGDELGYLGVKEERPSGDDAVRPEFPEHPGERNHMYRTHQDLIGLRRRNPWLVHATTETLALENPHIAYRSSADGHHIDVNINLDAAPPQAHITDETGATLWSSTS